jgi:uncharacterized repeat protein (TIGR01451 family)
MKPHYPVPVRSLHILLRVLAVLSMLLSPLSAFVVVQPVSAAAGSYSLSWGAADPELNQGPFLPTYTKVTPAILPCPATSGSTGRASDPLANAVYGKPRDAVSSLAPDGLGLGQIVPFEVQIEVSGSTAPENGVIQLTNEWLAKTTNGGNFGYDPAYGVYCAFVDPADPASVDPGNNAKVDSFTSTTLGSGSNNERIQGALQISGLDNGDTVIVEIWVVLKSTIPTGTSGNVQSEFVSAATGSGDSINIGSEIIPLRNVNTFFSTIADVAITKSDNPDPVIRGQSLTYTLNVRNNSSTYAASGVVVRDTLDPNTTFVAGTWPGGVCTAAAGVVTCNIGLLDRNQAVAITVVVNVSTTAPTAGTVQTGACTVGQTGVDLCNRVSVTTLTTDLTTSNNSASEPTNVQPIPDPQLALEKTASPATYSAAGQAINYSYLLTNSGNVTLSGPFSVSDDKATVTCPATASLAPGASLTCTATYPITQDDLDAGSVTNTAQAKAFFGQTEILSDQEQATVTATQTPGLSLVKTAAPANYATVGQSISYNYEVTNSGNVTLSGPFSVTDDKATVTCPATASLAPGASLTCTATYLVTQADLDAGSITNTATASNGAVTSQPDTETVYATAHPNLGLVKSATPATYSAVNDTISYEYELTNIGNVALSAPFAVTDDKASVTCPQTPNPLPVGGTLICTASHLVTQADLDAGFITNTASATAQHGGNLVTSNEAAATVSAVASPALAIDKSVQESAYAAVGDELHYSYVVRNAGNVTLHAAITVNDDKAAVTCPDLPVGGLAPGASITCEATYIVTQADLDAGSLTNIASATDGVNTSPTDTVTVPATQNPSLALVKTASPATYSAAGQAINYSYLLTNSGNVTLSGPFSVSDDKATVTCPATASLAPGASLTCTATYPITQDDLDAGSVTNTAQAKAFFGQTEILSDQEQATVTATQTPGLSLVKTAAPANYATVGQSISYNYEVTNSGNVTLSGPFSVTDDKATVTCPATASLAPGASLICTATYLVTQADLDAGSITNTATASNGAVTSQPDTETVYATAHPNLGLVKSATPATYSAVNDTISYEYELTNIGNVALSAPFAVTDDKASVTCPQTPNPLPVGGTLICTASHLVTQADLDAGFITNTASATAQHGGNLVTSNEAAATVSAVASPALAIDKSVQESAYAAVGDELHYSYVVRNAGNVTLHAAITVNDDKAAVTCPDLPVGGLAPGASITCEATYIVTQADLDAGSLTNIASATDGVNTSPTDTVTVPATQNPSLALVKTASPATYSAAGQAINYSYLLTNSGNVTLSGPFSVSDDKATVTCPATASLAPGASLTCTATYPITQDDLDAGSVTNTAQAKAFFGQTEILSDQEQATVTATQTPGLSLVKTAAPANYATVGQSISYNYEVTNSGNVTLSGPFSVTDDKATVTCPATASLAPGASLTCTATYLVTQADLDAGSITNTATASNGAVTSQPDTETVYAIQSGGLGLTKSASPLTYSSLGDVIDYTYVVQNTGNLTLNGPFTVNDDQLNAVACPAGSLAPGATVTCTASHLVTQADLDKGSITNIATATDGSYTSNEAAATVSAVASPALAIDKSVQESAYAAVGDELHYSYVVRNAGNVTLHAAITVNDDKAAVTCPDLPVGGLAPGASITCEATYIVTQADLDAGSLTNIASATDGVNTSPTDTVTVPATQTPSLALVKTASPATYSAAGQAINYSYLLTNSGNVTLSGPFSVSDDKATVTCPATASLAPGASLTCTATYPITQDDLDAGSVTNTAQAKAFFGQTEILSDQEQATVTATQTPGLSLVKTASPNTYDAAGDAISYSYLLTNSGNVTLNGPFSVSDDKATVTCPAINTVGNLNDKFEPGEEMTCTASYTIAQGDVDAGSVTNTAQAEAFFSDAAVPSNQDSETVNAIPLPDLALVKSADPILYDAVNQVIDYEYVLTNIGNVTLAAPFTVSDDKVNVTCPATPTSLAVGESITCSASHLVTQADLDAGSITNIATGHAQTLGGIPLNSNNDSATVDAVASPALAIDKSVQESAYAAVGDELHYSYVVRNAGNVTLHAAITVNDDKAAVTCPDLPVGGLAPGASITCEATYIVTQADLDAGSLTNIASATDGVNTSPTDTVTVPATQTPSLALVKTASPATYSAAGQAINYSYLLTNSGNVTLSGPFSVSDDKATVTCPATASLAPGASLTCTATYPITQDDLDAGSVTNTAQAKAFFGQTEILSDQEQATVTATQTPGLSLVKTASPNTYDAAGDAISYSYLLTNSGNVTLNGPFSVSDDKATVTCPAINTVGNLNDKFEPGEEMTCTASYTIAQGDVDAGSVTNTAQAEAFFSDAAVPSNQDSETVNAIPLPDLALVKSADPILYDAVNQVIDYEYVLTNIGNVTLAAPFTVSDDKVNVTCPATPTSLAVGESITCSASHLVTQADLDAGSITNIATGHAQTLGGIPLNSNNDSATVDAVASPALAIDKSVQESAYAAVGDELHYSYVVRNAGNVTLHAAITVNDDKAAVTCPDLPVGGLAPGASITCEATYIVTQADLDAGSLTNIASATDGVNTSPTDTVTVPATQTPSLALVKTSTFEDGDEDGFADVGELIRYRFLVTNNGNVTLSYISVTDPNVASVSCPSGNPIPSLASGASETCTGTYIITQDDINAGEKLNTALASGMDHRNNP